jgi:hypothetical protein
MEVRFPPNVVGNFFECFKEMLQFQNMFKTLYCKPHFLDDN